jgi:hypothetical protein
MASHAGATSTRAFVYGADARSGFLAHAMAAIARERVAIMALNAITSVLRSLTELLRRLSWRWWMGILIEAIGFGLLAGIVIGVAMFWALERR